MSEKKQYIGTLGEGDQIDDCFLVKSSRLAETRAGKPYLALSLMDRSGEMEGRLWDDAPSSQDECPPVGAVVLATGKVERYREMLQVKLKSVVKLAEGEADLSWFLPTGSGDVGALAAELRDLIDSVRDMDIRRLLEHIFRGALLEDFTQAPAAKNMHHAWLGGLLEHSLAVARLADRVSGLYPNIDRSLLLAGALLHDIGKIDEFSYERPPFSYTDSGRLVGHLVAGAVLVAQTAALLPDFPTGLVTRIQHLILSHHGRHEYGSPVLPMMVEAVALNFIDELDSKIQYFDGLAGKAMEDGYQWTEFQRPLERYLFVRKAADKDPDTAQSPPDRACDGTGQQTMLFFGKQAT